MDRVNEPSWIRSASGDMLALYVPAAFTSRGVQFLTPDDYGQQLGYQTRPAGDVVAAHVHRPVSRQVIGTQEVIVMRSGEMRVDIFDRDAGYVVSVALRAGDTLLLNDGGHRMEMVEDVDFLEIKQGPFDSQRDKEYFEPQVESSNLRFVGD